MSENITTVLNLPDADFGIGCFSNRCFSNPEED